MKKTFAFLFTLAVACLSSFSAQAQYAQGDITASAGISFGTIGYNWGYGGGRGFLPLSINAEYSINDKFAIGPYFGFYSRRYDYLGSAYEFRFRALSFGARGTLHATGLLNSALDLGMDEEKLDLYATLLLGFETYSWDYGDFGNSSVLDDDTGRLIIGPVVGVRYFFNPKFGAFFEAGRGAFGYGTLGVSAKF